MIVVDSSAINAVLLRESSAESVLQACEAGERFLAPALIVHEVANVLAGAVRRKRLTEQQLRDAEVQFFDFPWAIETNVGLEVLQDRSRRRSSSDSPRTTLRTCRLRCDMVVLW